MTHRADPKVPSRSQLEKFLPSPEAIRLFERLFTVAGQLTPAAIITLQTQIDVVETRSKSNQVLLWLSM